MCWSNAQSRLIAHHPRKATLFISFQMQSYLQSHLAPLLQAYAQVPVQARLLQLEQQHLQQSLQLSPKVRTELFKLLFSQ